MKRLLSALAVSMSVAIPAVGHADDRYIIKFKDGAKPQVVEALQRLGGSVALVC